MTFLQKFDAKDIDWRVSSSGLGNNGPWAQIVPYLTARAVMDRLDAVVGPDNWADSYVCGDGFVQCSLTVNGVTKCDAAEMTKIEPVKGGFSDAFKRAAVKWGIGRYLYDTPRTFAKFVEKGTPGAIYAKIDGQAFYWVPDIKGPSVGQQPSVAPPSRMNNTNANTEEPPWPTEAPPQGMSSAADVVANVVPNFAPGAEMAAFDGATEDYVVKFGKFKGQALKDIKTSDLEGYVKWIEGRGGNMKPQVAEFVHKAKEFVGFRPEFNAEEEIPF